jgi:hypothetical protein
VERPTPGAFKPPVKSDTVPMLPLVRDTTRQWQAGWCTYTDNFDKNPDIEVFCGGENEKTASAAACWRQGNLLHFGFEQTPGEMNENGQRLLLNAIAYITHFTEDRPIAVTPSVFAGPTALPRTYLDRRIREKGDISEISWMVTAELFSKLSSMKRDELGKWYASNRGYLHPNPAAENKLDLDEEARGIATPIDEISFLEKCTEGLEGAHAKIAAALLTRYAPKELSEIKTSAEGKKWLSENQQYLFFSDQGDYRWYVDPLARKRGVPSAQLRGFARASK